MSGGKVLLDRIEMDLLSDDKSHTQTVYIDVYDNSLSRKWLDALNHLLANNYHLEKNYCFMGFTESLRNAEFLCSRINASINAINSATIGYTIDDHFTVTNTITAGPIGEKQPGGRVNHDKLNMLHRYFEDLQGVSGNMSPYYTAATPVIKWHIRQLNLLCHEYESLILSMRQQVNAPQWRRPSQLMCWLRAPRFALEEADYELFGIDTICRPMGGVYVGVNKAVGKHHWEVFHDEGKDIAKLTTTKLASQTEAAGDFDIEWAQNTTSTPWMGSQLLKFKQWLVSNNFDPEDKSLTIGHPQVGQVDLTRSFSTTHYVDIWKVLGTHLNVSAIRTDDASAKYLYNWSESDYIQQQLKYI